MVGWRVVERDLYQRKKKEDGEKKNTLHVHPPPPPTSIHAHFAKVHQNPVTKAPPL